MTSLEITSPARAPAAAGRLDAVLQEALRLRWRAYSKSFRRCARNATPDSVHDLRVASRRLLAAIEAAGGLAPRRTINGAIREIRKRTRGLGSLRDVQLQLSTVQSLSSLAPVLDGLRRRLTKRERRLAAGLNRKLNRHGTHRVKAAVSDLRREMRKAARHRSGRAPRAIIPVLAEAADAVEATSAAIDTASPATIHQARQALRRFRYLAEVFQPLVPGIGTRYLGSLRDLQAAMGRIQDAASLSATVERYLGKHAQSIGETDRVHAMLERRQARLISALVRRRS